MGSGVWSRAGDVRDPGFLDLWISSFGLKLVALPFSPNSIDHVYEIDSCDCDSGNMIGEDNNGEKGLQYRRHAYSRYLPSPMVNGM